MQPPDIIAFVQVSDVILTDPTVSDLADRLGAAATPLAATGLWGSSAPILAGLLAKKLNRPLLLLAAHSDQADEAIDDIETIVGQAPDLLPAWETLPGEGAGAADVGAERARLCLRLMQWQEQVNSTDEPLPLITAGIQALIQPVPTLESLNAHSRTYVVGQTTDPERIAEYLVERGFDRLDQVEEPGDFALRGGIFDIFWSPDTDPVRIEFFGDQIESIRQFEVGSQRSQRTMTSVRITLPPDAAHLKPSETMHFSSYLPPDTLVVLLEPVEIQEIGRAVLNRLGSPVGHYPVEAVFQHFEAFSQLHLSRFPSATVPDRQAVKLRCASLQPFEAKATDAIRQLLTMSRERSTVVYCDNEGEQDRLRELIAQVIQQDALPADHGASVHTCIGLIHYGFIWTPTDDCTQRTVTVVAHHEIFRRYSQKRRMRKLAAGRPIESFLDLQEGDYVVHVLHGIARYMGMRTMSKRDSRQSEEFLTLKFADDATMHVPVTQIDLVQKYIGARGTRPTLSKLGGTRWQTTKEKVEEAITDLADDLLRIQASRESQPGIAFPQDTTWQLEFDNAFLYTPTPDQVTAVREIKNDMARPRPMDRLLCGDVGYGKTELAMRAAFKAIEFGKQVAVLVPTTVLADQHHRTFTERMSEYPFKVECINRFRTTKEQKSILAAAKKGHVDILIGTHRLLSKDVAFADLGLVIVDEEQRFGVEHKERLKHLRSTVDVLTLSATPIPRTLHMAMIGLRDISSLATPPMDRRAISTQVCTWSDELITESINRELNRDGQVFFVHNRVKTIRGVADRLARLVPGARYLIGHGQMPGDELEDVMMKFTHREADVLVCTSIIESGLDIPSANTIFIDRADMFGLADLHQLRGRVGRYKHHAHCYLLLSPDRPLTSTAARRLKAIEQFSELGAGFRIAMRDLEIRGAGNILGPEQSGNIAAIGYELYCQLLEQSVKRMRGEGTSERVAVHLDVNVEAYIPRSFIASDRQRMECYRRVAACRTPKDVELLDADLQDAYGRCPEIVDTLLTLTDIRVRAAEWNIRSIVRREPDLIFQIAGEIKKIEPLFAGSKGSVRVPDGQTLHWRLPENYWHGDTLIRVLRNLFRRQEMGDSGNKGSHLPRQPGKPTRKAPNSRPTIR
ncbi:MAG: transcription-repair coupling factor [Planctomycetota bacterium]